MNPTQNNSFKPKWRHFHPMDRVWVENPFDEDIVYQVADEHNRGFTYRLPAKKISELPGGTIATLGVKSIVDKLIMDNPTDAHRMWDDNLRSKHEKDIIKQLKTTTSQSTSNSGEINLGTSEPTDAPTEDQESEQVVEETPFPGLNEAPQAPQGLRDIVSASLPKNNTVLDAQ